MLKYNGYSLIELLISISIGLLILTVLTEIYFSTGQSLQLQSALYTMQNNAITAYSYLHNAIHQAGILSCAKLNKTFPISHYQNYSLTPENRIEGIGGKELIVRYADYPQVNTISITKKKIILLTNEIKFHPKEILIINDCKHAEIFSVQTVSLANNMQIIKPVQLLKYDYEKWAAVSRLVINHYYIADTKRKNKNGTSIHALYVKDIYNHQTELVTDIEALQLSFTIKTTNKFEEVMQIKNGDEVKGVSIHLDLLSWPVRKSWHFYSALQE